MARGAPLLGPKGVGAARSGASRRASLCSLLRSTPLRYLAVLLLLLGGSLELFLNSGLIHPHSLVERGGRKGSHPSPKADPGRQEGGGSEGVEGREGGDEGGGEGKLGAAGGKGTGWRGEGMETGGDVWEMPLQTAPKGEQCRPWLEERDRVPPQRSFQESPVRIGGRDAHRMEPKCAIPCLFTTEEEPEATFEYLGKGLRILWSMESEEIYPDLRLGAARARARGVDILMTSNLASDVPVPYFNWVEYDIMRPVPEEGERDAHAHAAAFISNCNSANFRLEALRLLQRLGVRVNSFGICAHNADDEDDSDPEDGPARASASKTAILRRHRFSLAFENSCVQDYVSEKFWQSLEAGSVPVVIGAPNIAAFAPSNRSIIHILSLEAVPEAVALIKRALADDKLYKSMLSWKTEGPTADFLALVDLAAVHSNCRLCIFMGDRQREKELKSRQMGRARPRPCRCREAGAETGGEGEVPVLYHLYVRERGMFDFESVFLSSLNLTLEALTEATRGVFLAKAYTPVWTDVRPQSIRGNPKALNVYRIYPRGATQHGALHGTDWFKESKDLVSHLMKHPCPELEVIYV